MAPLNLFFAAELSTHELATRPTRPDATWRVCVCVFAQYEYLVFGGNFGVT